MGRLSKILIILLLAFFYPSLISNAQLFSNMEKKNEVEKAEDERVDSIVQKLMDSLKNLKINEANAKLELEHFKLQVNAADSIKRKQQQQKIDSLRKFTQGSPVIVEEDTLFVFYSK